MSISEDHDSVSLVEVYLVDLSQDEPYLGTLRKGEQVNASGYFVRQGNRTVYPRRNRSLVVRLMTQDGIEGWGETYGLVAPRATSEIITDLLREFIIGKNPNAVETIHDELYDLMRVRGYNGGFYLDALAAIDIALWDIVGKRAGQPLALLWNPDCQTTIPGYISGLPKDTLSARCQLAQSWQEQGFSSFKFALPVSDEGAATELTALRKTLGDEAKIACDLHWAFEADEAIALAQEMSTDKPWFLEAPVKPEEIDALSSVAKQSGQPIAVGEEWRTVYDAKLRIDRNACHIIQPEMGHTGMTQFRRIASYAQKHDLDIIPHATIGSGIFLAASLQASAALKGVVHHEFQHSVFHPFRHFMAEPLVCDDGYYRVPTQPGIGVVPSSAMRQAMTLLTE